MRIIIQKYTFYIINMMFYIYFTDLIFNFFFFSIVYNESSSELEKTIEGVKENLITL